MSTTTWPHVLTSHRIPQEGWAAAHPPSHHLKGAPTCLAPKPSAVRSGRALSLLFQMQVKHCSWDVGCSFPHSRLVRGFDKTQKGRQSFDQREGVICYLSNCSQFSHLLACICFFPGHYLSLLTPPHRVLVINMQVSSHTSFPRECGPRSSTSH